MLPSGPSNLRCPMTHLEGMSEHDLQLWPQSHQQHLYQHNGNKVTISTCTNRMETKSLTAPVPQGDSGGECGPWRCSPREVPSYRTLWWCSPREVPSYRTLWWCSPCEVPSYRTLWWCSPCEVPSYRTLWWCSPCEVPSYRTLTLDREAMASTMTSCMGWSLMV